MKDDLNELEFAGRVRNVLNQGATALDQKAALRLYEARCDALRDAARDASHAVRDIRA